MKKTRLTIHAVIESTEVVPPDEYSKAEVEVRESFPMVVGEDDITRADLDIKFEEIDDAA